MRLTLQWSDVHAVRTGPATRLSGRTLEVNLNDLRGLIEADMRLQRVRFDLAQPDERCRIGRVFDVVAPRAKLDGDEDFPGVLGGLSRAGHGRTQALANVAVVLTDQQLQNPATLSLIDMSGPGAALTEFARTHNVVLSARGALVPAFKELVIRRIPEPATRLSGLRAGEIDIGQVFGDYLDQARRSGLRIHETPNAAGHWVVLEG
jgi:glycine reductase complex component B subunit alpha and beta